MTTRASEVTSDIGMIFVCSTCRVESDIRGAGRLRGTTAGSPDAAAPRVAPDARRRAVLNKVSGRFGSRIDLGFGRDPQS